MLFKKFYFLKFCLCNILNNKLGILKIVYKFDCLKNVLILFIF